MKSVSIISGKSAGCLAAIAVVAMGIVAAPVVDAKPKPRETTGKDSNKIILVTPAQLPESARQTGEAMLLHETGDGRKLLYIEQNHGMQLAIFDVTDPSNVIAQTAAPLDVPGPFDFVVSLGDYAELVRFRQGQGDAVLDLHKVKAPAIKTVQGLKLQGETERLGNDGFIVSNQANVPLGQYARDFQVVETANFQDANRVFDVTRVCQEVTNDDTGTTFLLTAQGLYLIRRPAVEQEFATHEEQMNHPG
jgi:hypothetical protein